MSIKGIDTQIMITRLPDNVRDTSALMKKPEVTQQFLAAQGKINDAHDQARVTRTQESEMEKIRTDVDEDSEGGYGGGDGGEKQEKGENKETLPELLVPPGNNVIDIRV